MAAEFKCDEAPERRSRPRGPWCSALSVASGRGRIKYGVSGGAILLDLDPQGLYQQRAADLGRGAFFASINPAPSPWRALTDD
jgi:hypothetical protein